MSKLNITIEKMYQEYLDRMRLPEDKMHPVQKIQVRQAFMGGLSSLIKIMMVDFDRHTEDECEEFLTNCEDQLKNYWKQVINDSLPKN